MSVVGRLEDGVRSGAARTGASAKRAAGRLAIAAAIVVVVMALVDRGQDPAAHVPAGEAVVAGATAVSAQPAVLTEARADEQRMACRYEIKATFGVSIFTESSMSSKRLARVFSGEELYGSCDATEGGKAIGCAGLHWETDWRRVHSGTTVGWSPASCLERVDAL